MYNPVNLDTCTDLEVKYFSDTHYCGVSACSMCPKNKQEIVKDEIQVLPLYKHER